MGVHAEPRVYLDATGSAPLGDRAREAYLAALDEGWADPRRLHSESRQARALLDGARAAIAEVLGSAVERTHFTPSPESALQRAVLGVAAARRGRGLAVATAVERSATLEACEFACADGVERVGVDREGTLDMEAFEAAVADPRASVAAVQHANQELGTVQPLEAAHAASSVAKVPLVVDATCSIGHLPAPGYWDALVAHPADWGGPAGLGVVALRPTTRWLAAWPSADDPWAPGGVSVPAALAAAVALEERVSMMAHQAEVERAWAARIRAAAGGVNGVEVLGRADRSVPQVMTFSCLYVDGEALVAHLDREGFSVGSGSACANPGMGHSHVLEAIGALTHGNVRIGLHPGLTDDDVDRFCAALPGAVAAVRAELGAP